MPPTYPPLPPALLLPVIWTALRGGQRSFRQDALRCTAALPLSVLGRENIPQAGPALIVMNHYHRPGFQAFWFSLAISAVTPVDIHWTMTGAWTDDGTLGAKWRAILSPHFLPRLARLYGFTSMPPMPPRPHETALRAGAVRHLLDVARQIPPPLLALAPEGMDNPAGGLMRPHPGVGRLLALLDGLGYPIFPVGVSEEAASLVLSFGPSMCLALQPGLDPAQRDRQAADQVMQAIAARLPAALRGDYFIRSS